MTLDQIQNEMQRLTGEYWKLCHAPGAFMPGVTYLPAAAKVFGNEEIQNAVLACLEFWLTTGRFNEAFERKLASFVGVRTASTTNSGSSANLLALASLTSPSLGEKALKPGDEIITVAAAFPTTVTPILQYGMIPVFVDVDIPGYNINCDALEAAIGPRTRAIALAHTLGNPFDVAAVMRLAAKHDLWVIEDCCDALGATYGGRHVGTFGDLATVSFYPAHHITMGEGGAVLTDDLRLCKLVESFRDWGRDCWCEPGKDNTCGKRYCWKLGDLPEGYDHKYIYSHAGYNLKITDIQAAIGLAQLDRLEGFIKSRRSNFDYLYGLLEPISDILILPDRTENSEPSWFGFPITLRPEARISRIEVLESLEKRRVGTRLLFGGNLIRQPFMKDASYRVAGDLRNTEVIARDTFWIGVHPGLNNEMLEYMAESVTNACAVGRAICR